MAVPSERERISTSSLIGIYRLLFPEVTAVIRALTRPAMIGGVRSNTARPLRLLWPKELSFESLAHGLTCLSFEQPQALHGWMDG